MPVVLREYWRHCLMIFLAVFSHGVISEPRVALDENKKIRLGIHADYVKRFPASKGVIWGNAVLQYIFAESGYEIETFSRPAKRLPITLSDNKIDAYQGGDPLAEYADAFVRSELPVAVVDLLIYYQKGNEWRPVWPPDAAFKTRLGVSAHSAETLTTLYGLKVVHANSFDASIKMVNLQRADYFIDNAGGYRSISAGLIKGEIDGFAVAPLFRAGIYMYFRNGDEGRKFRQIFDHGHRKLLEEGQYSDVFYQDNFGPSGTQTVDYTVEFINREYQLDLPHQN